MIRKRLKAYVVLAEDTFPRQLRQLIIMLVGLALLILLIGLIGRALHLTGPPFKGDFKLGKLVFEGTVTIVGQGGLIALLIWMNAHSTSIRKGLAEEMGALTTRQLIEAQSAWTGSARRVAIYVLLLRWTLRKDAMAGAYLRGNDWQACSDGGPSVTLELLKERSKERLSSSSVSRLTLWGLIAFIVSLISPLIIAGVFFFRDLAVAEGNQPYEPRPAWLQPLALGMLLSGMLIALVLVLSAAFLESKGGSTRRRKRGSWKDALADTLDGDMESFRRLRTLAQSASDPEFQQVKDRLALSTTDRQPKLTDLWPLFRKADFSKSLPEER